MTVMEEHGKFHDRVCKPQFDDLRKKQDEIHDDLKVLTKTITQDNGRPSVLSRLRALEAIEKPSKHKTVRELDVGKGWIKIRGYNFDDLAKLVMLLAILGVGVFLCYHIIMLRYGG